MSDLLGAVKRLLRTVLKAFKRDLLNGKIVVGKSKNAEKLDNKTTH